MRNLRGTYVHRGDASRRRGRIKRALLLGAFLAAAGVLINSREPAPANAEPAPEGAQDVSIFARRAEIERLRNDLEDARGELAVMRAQVERANHIIAYSTRFGINASMATSIYDAAMARGIDPELAFRLVQLESEFNPRATSRVGAVGLTQLMPSTAARFVKGVTKDRLYDRSLNLQIGFQYLRDLLVLFKGDVKLALLAYNRGEDAVLRDVKAGIDPTNGYDRWVMRGYTGRGLVD